MEQIQAPYKKHISLNFDSYSDFSTTERNAFHLYIALLSKFNNNIFTNYTYQEIASMVGVDRNSFFKYLNILEEWGYINRTDRKQHLVVIPQPKFKGGHFNVIEIYRSIQVKDVQKVVFQAIVSENINSQEFNIVMKDIVLDKPRINNNAKVVSKKLLYKLTKKSIKSKTVNGVVNYKTYTSMRKIAKLMGISLTQSHKLFHQMDGSMFKYKWNLELIDKNISYEKFLEYKTAYNMFNENYVKLIYKRDGGKVYIHRGSEITFGNNLIKQNGKEECLIKKLYSTITR